MARKQENGGTGFLPIDRKFFENKLWTEPRTYSRAEAWLDLNQLARWREDPGEWFTGTNTFTYNRGELVASLRYLEQRWRWAMTTVRRFLEFLEKDGSITRRTALNQTVISIAKYGECYPLTSNTSGRDVSRKQQNTGTPPGTSSGTDTGTHNPIGNYPITANTGTPPGTSSGTDTGTLAAHSRHNMEEGLIIEKKEEREGDGAEAPSRTPEEISFDRFLVWVNDNAPRVAKMRDPFTLKEYLVIAKKYKGELIQEVLEAMNNKSDLLKKYNSAKSTCDSWCRMRTGGKQGGAIRKLPHHQSATSKPMNY